MRAIIQSSKPYPLDILESLSVFHSSLYFGIEDQFIPNESLQTNHEILIAEIFENPSIVPQIESLQTSHSCVSGVVENAQSTINDDIFSISTSHQTLSFDVTTMVINYTNWPVESIQTTHQTLSGEIV